MVSYAVSVFFEYSIENVIPNVCFIGILRLSVKIAVQWFRILYRHFSCPLYVSIYLFSSIVLRILSCVLTVWWSSSNIVKIPVQMQYMHSSNFWSIYNKAVHSFDSAVHGDVKDTIYLWYVCNKRIV